MAVKALQHKQGKPTSYANLVEVFGKKLTVMSELAEATTNDAPWGRGRYWKLDGVSPKVKGAARIVAHRAGEGVGPWLDTLPRRELGLSARKLPYGCKRFDVFAPDRGSGFGE